MPLKISQQLDNTKSNGCMHHFFLSVINKLGWKFCTSHNVITRKHYSHNLQINERPCGHV